MKSRPASAARGATPASLAGGPGVDEPLVWYEGASTGYPQWLHADRQGSIVAWSSAGGYVAADRVYRYGPWGEPDDGFAAGKSRFRYTGQIMLPEARLYYYKARVYDPLSGRFLQTDPIGYEDDLNLYAYVGGDPVNKTDPTGNQGWGIVLSFDFFHGDDRNPISGRGEPATYSSNGLAIGFNEDGDLEIGTIKIDGKGETNTEAVGAGAFLSVSAYKGSIKDQEQTTDTATVAVGVASANVAITKDKNGDIDVESAASSSIPKSPGIGVGIGGARTIAPTKTNVITTIPIPVEPPSKTKTICNNQVACQ